MTIKIVCLNLWQGGLLFDEMLTFLRREAADILALQEVYDSKNTDHPRNYRSLEVLRTELGYPYHDFAPAMLDHLELADVVSGNAIFSKFPITKRTSYFFNEGYGDRDPYDSKSFPTTPRNLQQIVIDTPAGDCNVFNFQGVWDLDGDNFSLQRRRMSDTIIAAVKGKPRVILAGDTNAKPTNPAMRALEEHLVSVFGTALTTTFNMRRKDDPGYATAVVDMLYISKDMEVIAKACPPLDISDHLPLIATLQTL